MTNKPPPTAPSAYVVDTFAPLRGFLTRHAMHAESCSGKSQEQWLAAVIEKTAQTFRARVHALIETVKSMDAALNKRSKTRAATGAGLSDSEKILLQLHLDVEAFGQMVSLFTRIYRVLLCAYFPYHMYTVPCYSDERVGCGPRPGT